MNRKTADNYEQLAQNTGLRFHRENGVLYGRQGGFALIVFAPNPSYPYTLSVQLSAKGRREELSKAERKKFTKENKSVVSLTQSGNTITMSLKNISNQDKLQERLNDAVRALTHDLHNAGYEDCCQLCGKTEDAPTDPCFYSGGYLQLCPDCYESLEQNKILARTESDQKKENPVGGIVGAMIGTLLGVASIILFSRLGYVAALSGLIMAVCTLKGYELLGGKLSGKGILISTVLMLLMAYMGDRFDWAILVAGEWDISLGEAFRIIPALLQEDIISPGTYWGNLVMVYLFLVLGAFPTIRSTLKNQKMKDVLYRLEGSR
ncbi:MAG: hypothetical protein IJC59_02375 [Lachnospiraceae bacterium]|nr:hypothetical protein [Lachnospiraceae bacterium]